ncbi:MAG: type II toxin-antitoxin system VapC family toxin [Dehalococcoidia bacterium]
MNYLLDADAIIDHFEAEPGIQALYPTLAQAGICIAETTLIELYTGVYRSADRPAADRQPRAFLRTVTILPLTRRITLRAAQIRADLLNHNLSVRSWAYDILAAAFALKHGLTIVTSNTRDYRGVSGLTQLNSRTGQLTTH